jgi:predicted enzyme related to lactoylglutathione lyase
VLLCDDVASAYERALAEGGTSEMEPRTIEAMGITVAMVRDPDGYKVELVEQAQPVTRPL